MTTNEAYGDDEDWDFGNAIIYECIRLLKPRLVPKVEIIGWHSFGDTRHVVYLTPSWLEQKLLDLKWKKASTIVCNVVISSNGQVTFKGTNYSRWNKVSLHACVHLADPRSFERLGKMLIKCLTGKGELAIG